MTKVAKELKIQIAPTGHTAIKNCRTCHWALYYEPIPAAFDSPPEPGYYECQSPIAEAKGMRLYEDHRMLDPNKIFTCWTPEVQDETGL